MNNKRPMNVVVNTLSEMHDEFMKNKHLYHTDTFGDRRIVLRIYDKIDFVFDYNVKDKTYVIDFYPLDVGYNLTVGPFPDFVIRKNKQFDMYGPELIAELALFLMNENTKPSDQWTHFQSIKSIENIKDCKCDLIFKIDESNYRIEEYQCIYNALTIKFSHKYDMHTSLFQGITGKYVYRYVGLNNLTGKLALIKLEKISVEEFGKDLNKEHINILPLTDTEIAKYPSFVIV